MKGLYTDIEDLSKKSPYLVPNTELRGTTPPYVKTLTFLDASKAVDPAELSGSSVQLAAIPSPIVDKYIRLPSGSLTNPALSWSADAGDGLYRVGADDYAYAVNGSKVTEWLAAEFRVNYLTQGSVLFAGASGKIEQDNAHFFWDDTNNRLGIGYTTPQVPLDVKAALGVQLQLTASATDYSTFQTSSGALYITTVASGLQRLTRITDNGSGTAGSTIMLQVHQPESTDPNSKALMECFVNSVNSGDPYFRCNIGNSVFWTFGLDNSDSDKFKIATGSSLGSNDRVTIDTSGNVGVNTTGPDRKLDVLDASNPQVRLTYTDGSIYTDFQTDSSGYLTISPSGLRLYTGAGGATSTPQSVLGYFANTTVDATFSNGNDHFRIGEGRAMGNPTTTPTAVSSAGGLTGTYKYAYLEIDASGNYTGLSPVLTVVAVANQYAVTIGYPRAGALSRMLCRTKAGGSTYFLLHDFAAGDGAHRITYQDNTADGSLTVQITDSDTTKLYKMVGQVNTKWGGVFMSTHPDQSSSYAQDLTLLTADPTTGKVALDTYAGASFRSIKSPAIATRVTGTDAAAYQLTCGYLGTTDDGSSQAVVYSISPQGSHLLAPDTTGVTNPTWYKLTGGVAGNYIVARLSGTQNQGGLYCSSNNEPYFGANIDYSSGDTYSTANSSAAWRMGNPTASASFPWNLYVAAAGSAGAAITWTTAASVTSGGIWEFKDGSGSAPIITFQSNANTGIFWVSSGNLGITCNGTALYKFSNSTYFMLSDTATMAWGASSDTVMTRDAGAGIFAMKSGATAHTLRVYGTTTGPKYVTLKHDGTDATLDTAATSGKLIIGGNASDIQIGKALVALGGGAAPTLGTIGGSGPATAAQNTWLQLKDSTGATFWVPVWK